MKVAVAADNNQVALVLDFAAGVCVADPEEETIGTPETVGLSSMLPPLRAEEIAATGSQVVLCGGVSNALLSMLLYRGIRVITEVQGTVLEAFAAYAGGTLKQHPSARPGCRGFGGPGQGRGCGFGRGGGGGGGGRFRRGRGGR